MRLVDVHAVRDLLNGNIGQDVSHYAYNSPRSSTNSGSTDTDNQNSIFTDHGTLMAYDESAVKITLDKFAAFAGTVWRNHNAQIAATGSTNAAIGGIPAIQTVDARLTAGGESLEQLTVKMDGVVSVVRLVVPRLLVAAQLGSNRVEQATASSGTTSAETVENGNGDSVNGDGSGEDNRDAHESADFGSRQLDINKEPGAHEEVDNRSPSKMRILELKAEGMAEFLSGEYPTILPKDFF